MRKITVFTNLTLDGVMQAPAAPDEDRRGGFEHGGWATPCAAMQEVGDALAFDGALLFGRRTYEQFASFWPNQRDNPMAEMLTQVPKYVASPTLPRAAAVGKLYAAPWRRGGSGRPAQTGAGAELPDHGEWEAGAIPDAA